MSRETPYNWRLSENEYIISAPNDDEHQHAFTTINNEAYFDSVLEEWRIPTDGVNVEDLLNFLESRAGRRRGTNDGNRHVGTEFGYACADFGEGPERFVDTLRTAGIPDERIFLDRIAGREPDRPGLARCTSKLKNGDTLVVSDFNQLARSLTQFADVIEPLESKGIFLRSVDEGIDTALSEFRHFVENVCYASKFERRASSQRTIAGLNEAKAKGKKGGGRRSKMTEAKIRRAVKLAIEGWYDEDIAKDLEVSRATLYRKFKSGLSDIRRISEEEGEAGIEAMIEELVKPNLPSVTRKMKEDILKLYKADIPIPWIAERLRINAETIRLVIDEVRE